MADLTKVNLNGTEYNFKDSNAIKGVQVNGVDLTIDSNKKVNIVNDYIMKTTIIDCTSLDQDSWYPVTFQLSAIYVTLIEISLHTWNSGVSWSTHKLTLISSKKIIEMLGLSWGENYDPDLTKGRVNVSNVVYCEVDPIQKLGQVSQVSLGYVYVRGGAKYIFRLSGNITPVLHTTDYAVTSGSTTYATLAVLTSTPNALINVTIANKSDIKDGVLTLQKNGVSVGTFSANQSTNKTINIGVPTKLSEMTDDVVAGKYLPLLGGTMLGDLILGGHSLVLLTDTSWTNSDRSIPFGVSGQPSKIGLYKKDFTYNPNTGALKAGSFIKNGGTSAQFLKADGSVDSNKYLTQNTLDVEDLNPTLNYGEQNIKIANINGQGISVNMPEAPTSPVVVVNDNPTLAWGTTKQIGTVGDEPLSVTMPANPNTDTKVTSVANHYTPLVNASYNLPANVSDAVFIKQIQRDAKGHVVSIVQGDMNFTTYGLDVTLETATNVMSNSDSVSSPASTTPQNVLKFLLRMAEASASNPYNKYCNGFITQILLSTGTATATLVFNDGFTQHTINTGTPIYFEFYCDNVAGFIENKGGGVDAHATLYATTPAPYYYPCIITLDWKSGAKKQVWGVFNPNTKCSGTASVITYDDVQKFSDEIGNILIQRPYTEVLLNASGETTISIKDLEGKMYGTRKLKVKLPEGTKNNVALNIDKYYILMNRLMNEVTLAINFDVNGTYIDCSIS